MGCYTDSALQTEFSLVGAAAAASNPRRINISVFAIQTMQLRFQRGQMAVTFDFAAETSRRRLQFQTAAIKYQCCFSLAENGLAEKLKNQDQLKPVFHLKRG